MRKRSASESGRGNPTPAKEEQSLVHAKLRKIRHNSGKGEDGGLSKRKSHLIDTPNSTNKRKTQANVDETPVNNRYSNHNNENAGIVGNLRRTTSVPASVVEENLSTRRRTVTGNTENDTSKPKQEPLPDIMHDWEIIVKSLRETPAEENSTSKMPKAINYKANAIRSVKQDLTDSDKENSSLKKKIVDESAGKANEFMAAPSTSSNNSKFKNGKEKDDTSTPSKIHSTETSLLEEAEATWRRPTRSTYKAFENAFESPEQLVEVPPLDGPEVNGEHKKDVQALKVLLTPKKVNHGNEASSSKKVNHGNEASSSKKVNHGNEASSSKKVNHGNEASSSKKVNHGNEASSSKKVKHGNEASSSKKVNHGNEASSSKKVNHGNEASSSKKVNHGNEASSSKKVNHGNEASSSKKVNHGNEASSSKKVNHGNEASSSKKVNHGNEASSSKKVSHGNETSSSKKVNHGLETSSDTKKINHGQDTSSTKKINHGQEATTNTKKVNLGQESVTSKKVNHGQEATSTKKVNLGQEVTSKKKVNSGTEASSSKRVNSGTEVSSTKKINSVPEASSSKKVHHRAETLSLKKGNPSSETMKKSSLGTEVSSSMKKVNQRTEPSSMRKLDYGPETSITLPGGDGKEFVSTRSLLKNKERKAVAAGTVINTDTKNRGRSKRTPFKDGKKIKGRRITRGMEKGGITVISEESDESSDDKEDTKMEIKVKSPIPETNTDIKNTSGDSEMDFIGFGSPPSSKKSKFKMNTKSSYKEVIEEETLREDNTTFSPLKINDSLDFLDVKDYVPCSSNEDCKELKDNYSPKVEHTDVSHEDELVDNINNDNSDGFMDIITSKSSPHPMKSSISLSEYECLFGSDEDSSTFDFEGFPTPLEEQQKSCQRCSLVLGNLEALKQHVKVGHRRVYACPFDLGQCGQYRGSIELQNHLRRDHTSLLSFLQLNISSDIQSGKIANWTEGEEGCGVCLMPLEQPHRCIHEMLVHCIWPPSLLSLSSVVVDQHVSLWWTGRTLAFACHLCHTPQTALSRNYTIPIVTSSPHCFPTLFSNHLRNVHLLNLPLIQGWWLMIRLLVSLPAIPRRTLSSIVSLGVDSKVSYSSCLICSSPLSFYCNINLKISYGLCSKCEYICRSEVQCWFNCRVAVPARYNFILNHLLSDHKSQIPGAWCVVCGAWAPNILIHLAKCGDNKSSLSCKFCTFKLEGLSILRKAWHSLNHHTYPCPIPNCVMPLYSHGQPGSHHRLPTARTLLNHLLGQHLPEWVGFTLDQVSTLIYNSKKTHGVVLTAFSGQHLNGMWRSLTGHKYCLNKGVLSPVDTVKVSMMCLLCLHCWEEDLAWPSKEESALCSECTLMLSQCGGGDLTPQCPVFKCLENISSFTDLYQHLTLVHKLSPLSNRTNCSYCGSVSLGSPLSTITHNLLQHNIACLLCPFTAPTVSQIHAHRATMHGLPSWDAVFQHLKLEDLARKKSKGKPKLLGGVVRVWNGENGVHAQWDPPMNITKFLGTEHEEPEVGVINQSSIQEPYFITAKPAVGDLNEVDPWCSSLCTVSMSPSKHLGDAHLIDRDIKSEISPLVTKMNESSSINNMIRVEENGAAEGMSPELLIPSVTVAEDSEENSTDSEGQCYNEFPKSEDIKVPPDTQEENISDSSDEADSGSEPALEIDSSAPSPEPSLSAAKLATTITKLSKNNNIDSKLKNCLTVTIPVSIPSALEIKTSSYENSGSGDVESESSVNCRNPTNIVEPVKETVQRSTTPPVSKVDSKTPTFGLVDTLNSVMAETLQSMNKALSNSVGQEIETPKRLVPPLTIKNHSSKKGEPKGLGENAFIDVKSMGENILKDLEEKYSGTCVGCGNSILLPHLSVHIKSIHPGKLVHCSCGFKGELYTTLVHSFHMSHIPNEARPIVLSDDNSEGKIMIVLEARPDLKAITFPCFKCSKRFKQEKSRQLHYNLCKLEKKFSCELCGEKFALENHLLKHKEWKHNPQTCSHCGKEFNSSSSLTQHVLHIHKKPLNQRCKHCGDTFNNAKQLKVHSRIHSGEQPHACSHCSISFISRNLLQKHIAIHHKRTFLDEDSKNDRGGRHKVKHKSKIGKGDSSSSDSDSSDSENELKKKYNEQNARLGDKGSETEVKTTALTESDLDTSSSDVEVPVPKKSKPASARKPPQNKEQNSVQKGLDLKMNKAGIYQDKEVVTLPLLRDDVKEKVESSVGRVCNPCGQEFDSAAGKLLHMYLIHPGLVLTLGFHDCSFCQHKFTSADDVSNHHLDKHQRTSLLNGNFRCICGLVFREDGAYYFHLYYAHKAQRALNIGGEIVCRLCEGRPRLNKIVDLVVHLSDRHTMFDHVRFNDSYMCNFCYKAFESWTVLSLHFFMVHKATKSQTLSYDCPYCQGASPWHSLEALQYHLDNVHRGRHTQSRPVPEHSRSIYTPAPTPASPTKRKEPPLQIIQMRKPPKSVKKPILHRAKGTHADPDVLYCICQCPYDEVSDMIGCDNPECKFQWFHFECVGIMAAPEGNWYCPDCTSFAQQKLKQAQKQKQLQADLYEYYSNYSNDATENEPVNETILNRSRTQSSSSNSSSSNSSSSSSNSSSSSSSSSDSSSGSGEEN